MTKNNLETITISKHTLIVGISFLAVFIIGMCLGITIGFLSGRGKEWDRMYVGMNPGNFYYQGTMMRQGQLLPAKTIIQSSSTVAQ